MSCISLSNSITPNCEALKRPGGLAKRVFLGSVLDINSITFDNTNPYDVTALTFKTGKRAIEVIGRPAKSSAATTFEDGENFSLRNQALNVITYIRTPAERKALDEIINQDQVFGIVERNDGKFEVYGINLTNYQNWGLKVTGGSYNTGVELNDETGVTLELTGGFTNVPLTFGDAASNATNLAALIALLTPAS
jgi:hypothetical protein